MVPTYHPIKDFREVLPIETFLYPNKGIIAAASQILTVEDGYYKMADEPAFKYRVHNSLLHDSRLLMLGRSMERMQQYADKTDTALLKERFSILDNMPLAVCDRIPVRPARVRLADGVPLLQSLYVRI